MATTYPAWNNAPIKPLKPLPTTYKPASAFEGDVRTPTPVTVTQPPPTPAPTPTPTPTPTPRPTPTPPPVTMTPPPPPGGEGSCAEGACAGGNPPSAPPSFGTPITNFQPPAAPAQPDVAPLAQMMAAMIPSQQSQAVYVGGETGQPLPGQADRSFRGRDPNVRERGFGNYMDALRAGFWG